MLGNGIEMYDLLPDVTEDDVCYTNMIFWVGVMAKLSPSPPIPRKDTNSFTSVPVYYYGKHLVFGMNQKTLADDLVKVFYYIPENEKIFIQEI